MAGSETFDRRMDELAERVGYERIRGSVVVDQVYAQYQHEGLDLKHPRGGQAKYLEQPLYQRAPQYVQEVADSLLTGNPRQALADAMEDLSQQVFELAPIEFLDLRASGHPTVRQGARTVYDRPPMQARLTPAQLRAKNQLRRVTDMPWDDL